MDKAMVSRKGILAAPSALLASLLALGSAAVHLMVTPEHFQEWWGYGVFFLSLASFQLLYGLGLLVREARLAASPRYLVTGILGSLLIIEVYTASRVLGIPPIGPHAGHVEGIGALDVVSKALELGLVATLVGMLVRLPGFKPSFGTGARLATAAFLAVTVAIVFMGLSTQERDEIEGSLPLSEPPTFSGAPAQTLPTWRELLSPLTRSGDGPGNISVDMLYSPPLLFRAVGEEMPASSLERPTVIFTMLETHQDHEHKNESGLAPQPPQVLLRLDRGGLVEPYEVTVLSVGDGYRKSQLLYPLPSSLDPRTIDQQEHTLALVIPMGSEGQSTFTWQLPLGLSQEVSEPTSLELPGQLPVSALSERLTRAHPGIAHGGKDGIKVEATYATPDYFSASFSSEAASRYLPGRFTAFVLTEKLHTANLPLEPLPVSLSLDGRRYEPDLSEQVTTSAHHRVTLVRFPVEPPLGVRHRVMELELPGDAVMTWHLPISYAGLGSGSGLEVTWVWLLAVLGGLVAAMWPCLFQLTVFFIPALGGLSMHEASGSVSIRRRASVVKAALFFVLGFTVVYTTAGALLGSLAGRLGDMSGFYTWQRYLGIAGGVVILLLALRVAAKVRAPLVCKMPVLSSMGRRTRPANPLEMMVAGVAFATGCMTCFGAAIVVAMVVYVGLSGSAFIGAFTLFLFSMGMGIPLVIAAMAMAKVLPLLSRFEKAIRWMGLASSLVMVGFAILLITGNYMVLTEWVYRLMPLA